MKKFKFKLQILLDEKQKKLEDKQLELSKIQYLLKQQEEVLNSLIEKHKSTLKNLENMLDENKNAIDLISIDMHKRFLEKLSLDIQNQHKIIADTTEARDLKKQEVIEAMKETKMLEKLKEKHYKEFLIEFETQSQKELEDITQARFRLNLEKQII